MVCSFKQPYDETFYSHRNTELTEWTQKILSLLCENLSEFCVSVAKDMFFNMLDNKTRLP